MKNQILGFLFSLIPIKSIRHRLKNKYLKKSLFLDMGWCFKEVKIKKNTILSNKDIVKTLFLGSSHIAYAINPKCISNSCFNLGSSSQDFYASLYIYKTFEKQLKHLKNVVIGVDVFSKGFSLERPSASHICAVFNFLYNTKYNLFGDDKKPSKELKKLNKLKYEELFNINGYLEPPNLNISDPTVDVRVGHHLREHNRTTTKMYNYLKQLIDLIYKNKQKCYLLLPPYRKDYLELLPKNLVKNSLKDFKHIKILDFTYDKCFEWDDFYDFDHLNSQGAKKLSSKLKDLFND